MACGSGAPAAIVACKQRLGQRTAFPSCVGARLSEACPAACATAYCRLLCAAGSCPPQGWQAAALRVKAMLGCSTCWFKGSELLCCTADMSQQRCTEALWTSAEALGHSLERPSGERPHLALARVGPRGQGATRYLTRWRNPSAKSMKTGRKIPMPWKLGEEDFFA